MQKTNNTKKHTDAGKKRKDMKLSGKISLSVGILLTFMLIILIVTTIFVAKNSLTSAIDGELNGLASENSILVQNVVNDTITAAEDLQDYLDYQYSIFTVHSGPKEKSLVFDVPIEAFNADLEDYILNTAWTTVERSDYISAVSVAFEPNTFDSAIEAYSIYVTDEDAGNKTASNLGSYEEYGNGEYYKHAVNTKEAYFTTPYDYNGKKMITASFPITSSGIAQGAVMIDIDVDKFAQIDKVNEKYPTLYGNIIDSQGIYIYDVAGVEWSGEDMAPYFYKTSEYDAMMELMQGDSAFKITTTREDGRKVNRYCYPVSLGNETWWAQSILDLSDVNKDATKLILIMSVMSIIVLILIINAMVQLVGKFLKPIGGIVTAADRLSAGDFDVTLNTDSNDEIGQLAKSFQTTISVLSGIISDLNRGMAEMASGNFDIRPAVEYPGELEGIKTAIQTFIHKISDTLTRINNASEQVAGSSEQIASGAQALTEGATDQASSIEELQATVTDVSGEVDKNAKNSQAANEMASAVGAEIDESNSQMQEMVNAMNTIAETSGQINNIISTINDIASQTNLLALNASIEAARAGEMGKGFAVVASEVGNLAAQSAEAAKNSTALIMDAIRAVENGRHMADATAEKLKISAGKTQELVEDINQITEASVRQAGALDQITQAVEQIASVVEENTAMAQESAASSEEMSTQAQLLKDLVGQFSLKK